MGYSLGLNEFKTPIKLAKRYNINIGNLSKPFNIFIFSLVAELIGTMFLVMIGCGSAMTGGNNATGVTIAKANNVP